MVFRLYIKTISQETSTYLQNPHLPKMLHTKCLITKKIEFY
ncbi:Hypothetical protein BN2458_PEG0870 [Helicobacter typhlonius]|uniref:Uncharacterized protein n=1 Tax=Helicobacter typhlonius TaxID=76936 RepID=A0A0S4PUQ5_9HELI|nr:Hypothetical protein BN2458_PEG0870 [Helicobacter typhlonius]